MRGRPNSAVGRGRRLSPQKGSNFLENMNTCSYLPNMDVSPEEERTAEIAETFHLLGDATRLRIMLACLDEPVPVGAPARRVGASASLVRLHLRLLARKSVGTGKRL